MASLCPVSFSALAKYNDRVPSLDVPPARIWRVCILPNSPQRGPGSILFGIRLNIASSLLGAAPFVYLVRELGEHASGSTEFRVRMTVTV